MFLIINIVLLGIMAQLWHVFKYASWLQKTQNMQAVSVHSNWVFWIKYY